MIFSECRVVLDHKMFVYLMIVACAFVACSGKQVAPVAPATPAPLTPGSPLPNPVLCSEPPNNLFKCIGNIDGIYKEAAKKCNRGLSECDSIKCIFRESGWALPGDKVNKTKVSEYFTQYAVDHPEWAAAVNYLKPTCLGVKDLAPQGATLDCEPYDVLHCILTSFLRNAAAGQWKGTTDCSYPRSYAQSCLYCPSSCFSAQIPIGSCNACLGLPSSP